MIPPLGVRAFRRFTLAALVCLVFLVSAAAGQASPAPQATPGPKVTKNDPKDAAEDVARDAAKKDDTKESSKPDRLAYSSRLALVRALAHEYAEVLVPLPAARKAKEAVLVDSDGTLNEDRLRKIMAKRGVAIETGTVVQITGIKFKKRHILLEVNGGGKIPGIKWYERIQIIGAGGTVRPTSNPRSVPSGANWTPGSGSYIRIDFGRRIPELSPDEIRVILARVLAFGKDTSTLPWIETIPEEFRDAIREKRALVGMNRDMVMAALGKPERKVREIGDDGQEYEDWIFGIPPYLVFVTFLGDEVVQVREFK